MALREAGIASALYDDPDQVPLDDVRALVFVKSFAPADLALAERASAKGVPIVLDLCDHIFIDGYAAKGGARPAEIFVEMARLASAVVTTGTALQAIIQGHIGPHVPVWVVPDGVETVAVVAEAERLCAEAVQRQRPGFWGLSAASSSGYDRLNLKGKLRWWLMQAPRQALRQARTALARRGLPMAQPQSTAFEPTPDLPVVVWFGNHGAPHAAFGMLDLLPIADALARVAEEVPFELVVVSNHPDKFRQAIAPLPFHTRYVEWSPSVCREALAACRAVLVPNSLDPFSLCKSANRTVTALMAGAPVVATRTSALAPFEGCVVFDDWRTGLLGYLTDPALARRHVDQGQAVIEDHFAHRRIAEGWLQVLTRIEASADAALSGPGGP
jgi:glycosyltransferase involved in cell wall biosynthesis